MFFKVWEWMLMNGIYEINLTGCLCESGLVGHTPTLGLSDGLISIFIARCTMLLTGAPLELNHSETLNNDGYTALVAYRTSRLMPIFIKIKTG